jgi:hypothetical protein
MYAIPGCYPWFGPPPQWVLVSEPIRYKDHVAINSPLSIKVKNTFDGMINDPAGLDGRAIRDTLMKQVKIWGWVRLYEGPMGCGSTGSEGTPIPPETKQKVWYIDAVKLQFLESIEIEGGK